MSDFGPDCTDCGKDLYINPVSRPNVDWVKVVCSSCGCVNTVSMIRLGQEKRRAEGVDIPGSGSEGGSS